MFRFIKTLERQVFIAVILVAAVTALAARGFGGAPRGAITAMAETPAVSYERERQETGKGKEILAAGEEEILRASDGRKASNTQYQAHDTGELMEETSYGQKVVGYLLTQDSREERERREAAAEAVSSQDVSLSREDYQVLLRIVEAEAGICDMKGKILVANVILNRVRSGEFPDSVTDVVYQPSQFSPVANGTINTCKVSNETVESVDRALRGEDYSRGALFFMNREAARGGSVRWFDGQLTYLFGHQGHEFFK